MDKLVKSSVARCSAVLSKGTWGWMVYRVIN